MSYIGKQPTKAPLTASDIEDGIITAAKIEDGAVVAAEIASNAVTTAKINADAVTSAKIADNAVVTAAINADAVTGAKIADDAINSEHYTDGSIDTAHLAADAVTAAKIADNAISEEHLDVTAITGHTAETSVADGDLVVIHDASATALRKMTVANLTANAGGGKILQVLSSTKTARQSTTSTSPVDISDMSVAITPSASNSKIFITAFFGAIGYNGVQAFANLVRGSTNILLGDSAGSTQRCTIAFGGSAHGSTNTDGGFAMSFLDSPNTTSATTYKMQFFVRSGGNNQETYPTLARG